jgi:hypothetical protein
VLFSDGDVIGRHLGFRVYFLPFLPCRRSFWVLFKEPGELIRRLARSGEEPITRLQTLDFEEHEILSSLRAPITLKKLDFPPRERERRRDLFGKTRSNSSGFTPGCSSISCRPNTFGIANPLHRRQSPMSFVNGCHQDDPRGAKGVRHPPRHPATAQTVPFCIHMPFLQP